MTDYSELKRLAESAGSGEWGYSGSYVCPVRREGGTTYVESWRMVADCYQPENTQFIAAANPAAVLALIAEVEKLKARDSEHVRQFNGLSEFRQLTVERYDVKVAALEAENEELRKDAERYQAVREFWPPQFTRIFEASFLDDQGNDCGEERSTRMDLLIDAAMSKEPSNV